VYDKVLHQVRWDITPYAMWMTPNHSRRKRLGDAVANAMASVIDTIREMVLEMMPEKTEAIFIFDKGEGGDHLQPKDRDCDYEGTDDEISKPYPQ